MSMLSEQRRKTKWVINSTKKPLWSADSNGIKFGKQLMEKMGWSAGKGLGLNEQGIQEPIRLSFKNDTKGMGFKGNDDEWIEHQDEFNTLLSQLRGTEDSSVVDSLDVETNEIKSLEEKSKTSKARVHYQKFTRGKDLSRYSENDLACILGTNKIKKKKQKHEEVNKTESETNGHCDTSFGVTTINSGSLQDYFKKKWIINKNKSGDSNSTTIENSTNNVSDENCTSNPIEEKVLENERKKSKKKKYLSETEEHLSVESNRISEFGEPDSSEKVLKRKRKKGDISSDDEPKSKKTRRKNKDSDGIEDEDTIIVKSNNLGLETENFNSVSKKGKENIKLDIIDEEDNSSCIKEKKEKKKIKVNFEHCNNQTDSEQIYTESYKKKKKKKEKKLKNEDEEGCPNQNKSSHSHDNDGGEIESYLNEKSTKSKKNKGKTEAECLSSTTFPDHSESCAEENVQKFNEINDNAENISSKKKKKKKDKKEKLTEEELNSCHKNPNPTIDESENTVVEESGKKKKKKKLEEKYNNNVDEESLCYENENIKKSVKKKKKQKDKSFQDKSEIEDNPLVSEQDGASVHKKKKKKKEKLEVESKNKNGEPHQLEAAEVLKSGESGTEKNSGETVTTQDVSNVASNTEAAEQRIKKLTVNLFGDKDADKYFPQQRANERVLKTIKWVDISEFKGANLKEVEGYGRRVMNQKQSS